MDSILYIYISWEMTPISIGGEKQASISGGSHLPADIASGRIAEVRSRSMSCNCMTRTSQQECRGILEMQGDCGIIVRVNCESISDMRGTIMVKIDLITGFLGAGKTTFIKEYASYLLRQGLNIGILENDFGAVNVDMMLLQELQGEKCELEMISGGCDKETHRRRFKTKLISMAMCGYDRVIVEPSGIYDVDEFFDGLREEPLDRWYEIGSVITIVDAGLEDHLSDQAEYLLGSEAADAGVIVLSRLDKDNACEEQENRIISHVNRSLERIGCTRRIEKEVIAKDWDMLTEEDFAQIQNSSYQIESFRRPEGTEKDGFQTLYFMNLNRTEEELVPAVKKLFGKRGCTDDSEKENNKNLNDIGRVFRVKGFMKNQSGDWMELNATTQKMTVNPIKEGQEILIVIGEDLKEDKIRECLEDKCTEGAENE